MVWKPHVTVAAVARQGDRFLLVEERIEGRLCLNQPAGHLEDGESLLAAVRRDTVALIAEVKSHLFVAF